MTKNFILATLVYAVVTMIHGYTWYFNFFRTCTPSSGSTTANRPTWSMDQDLPYFQRYFGLMMNGMIGKAFERGLENFIKKLETS